MGRPVRIQFPGACYYVSLRGRRRGDGAGEPRGRPPFLGGRLENEDPESSRENIFLSDEDRRYFLKLIGERKTRHGLKLYAYCLLDDKVQLLVEPGQMPLARVMQTVGTAYAKYLKRRRGTSGPVFGGRYRAHVVDKAKYLADVSYYIHLAPARAGLKEKPWRYPWSSCPAYVESLEREPMVDSDVVLKLLAKNRLRQSVMYLKNLKERMKSGIVSPLPVYRSCIGDKEFAASLSPSNASMNDALREKTQKIIDKILSENSEKELLLGPSRRRDIAAIRRQTIRRIYDETGVTVSELARIFSRTPAAISQMVRAPEATSTKN